MAKKKDGPKLPKRIGGVKLTKELRKAGGKLLDKANSPLGRELIAAGLTMAAAAASTAAKRERDKHAAPKGVAAASPTSPGPARPGPKPNGSADPHEMGVVLGKLAQDALGRIFAGKPKG